MVYWNTKPPPGPLDKLTERIYLVLGILTAILVVGVIVSYCIGIFQWFFGR